MDINKIITIFSISLIIILYYYYQKDTFYNLETQDLAERDIIYRPRSNKVITADYKNNSLVTYSDISRLFKELTIYSNGPSGGHNVNVEQNNYDLIFKDIVISSEKRNYDKYSNPNKYSIDLNLNMDKIYKAELIDVYIPAATDDAINIPTWGNRLYFTYTNYKEECCTAITTTAYIIIQAGTYLNPDCIASELTRQFNIVLKSAGFELSKKVGISVVYNRNLNRYIFRDRNYDVCPKFLPTFIIYTSNGYIINMDITVKHSITDLLMLNYEGPEFYSPYMSGPKIIKSHDGILYVAKGETYGAYLNDCMDFKNVSNNIDSEFSNCIISDVVLTNCKIFLSLGKLDGTTCNIITDQSGKNKNIANIFCQVPNNTCISSSSVKTLLGQPTNLLIQFYNPPISRLNRLDIRWYSEDGKLLRLLDHCFTVRIHYFQKRIDTTDFSYPIP